MASPAALKPEASEVKEPKEMGQTGPQHNPPYLGEAWAPLCLLKWFWNLPRSCVTSK